MKRVISMVLALMLVLGLAMSASAATVVNDTTHAYKAYQIFAGTQTGTDANLGNIVWGTGVNGDQLLTDLKTNNATKTTFAGVDSAEKVAEILANKDTPIDAIRQFAQLAYNNINTVGTDIPAGAADVSLPAGYYLIVDATTPAEGDAKNPALLQVTNAGPIHIQKKYDVPEHEKTVIADDTGDTADHVKAEDTPIGQQVEFHLKAEMPLNMEGYEKYTMVFHDDLSDGLTLEPSTISVYIADKTEAVDASLYTVTTPVTSCDRDGEGYTCDFHVVIDDVMKIPGYTAGCDVIVKYKATLNDKALINIGNPNHYSLEYSNDPNWDPDDPDHTTHPTGVTPWKSVKVFTTEVEIVKLDGTTDLPLQGAEFTLEGATNQKVKVTKNTFEKYADDETVQADNKYWLLKDGSYTNMDPDSPEMDKSKYKEPLTDLYKQTGVTVEWKETNSSVLKVTAAVGEDGTVKFGGLGEGTYTVTETKVPDGYNGLKEPLTLTIVFHESEERWEYSWGGGAIGSSYSIKVNNMKGSVLPETGGMGTTIFYIIGGLMVAASAVLLVTKKRMNAE